MRIGAEALAAHLADAHSGAHNLFAYPTQPNFSGVQHALDWIPRAQSHSWDILLDAAAFAPTKALDLDRPQPEFVSLAFYKIFGYLTDIGCLLSCKRALARLQRPWFAGGTITVASVRADRHYLHQGAEALEDGTLNFLALPAISIGLRHIQRIGHAAIHTRVVCLTPTFRTSA
jgi:molybdenum cofactor sulfurtransferase